MVHAFASPDAASGWSSSFSFGQHMPVSCAATGRTALHLGRVPELQRGSSPRAPRAPLKISSRRWIPIRGLPRFQPGMKSLVTSRRKARVHGGVRGGGEATPLLFASPRQSYLLPTRSDQGGQHTTGEIAELVKVVRSTVFRIMKRTPTSWGYP